MTTWRTSNKCMGRKVDNTSMPTPKKIMPYRISIHCIRDFLVVTVIIPSLGGLLRFPLTRGVPWAWRKAMYQLCNMKITAHSNGKHHSNSKSPFFRSFSKLAVFKSTLRFPVFYFFFLGISSHPTVQQRKKIAVQKKDGKHHHWIEWMKPNLNSKTMAVKRW